MFDKTFHIDFRLNDFKPDSVHELLNYSKSISSQLFLFLSKWYDASDDIYIQTSGSTGKPKSIKIKKAYMVNSALATGSYFELKPKTTVLLCLSLEYIAGKMMIIRSLVLGLQLDIIDPVSRPLTSISCNYDFTAMVPLQLNNSIHDLNKIGTVIVGGGKVGDELKSRIWDLPTRIYGTYGMTETVTHIAVRSLNKASGFDFDNDYYQSLPNVILSTDHRNCLVIDAPKIASQTIITNDIVDLLSETKFKWLGRYDNIINSGGIKLIPEEIERKIQTTLKNRFFIGSIEDVILGEKVVMVIEGAITDIHSKEILNRISKIKSIHKFEIPKEVYFVKKFEMTGTHKIRRQRILNALNK